MAWFIDDLDQYRIYITDTVREWYVPKFGDTITKVDGDFVLLYWNDVDGRRRLLSMNYNDVVDSYSGYVDNPTSASDLQAQIEAMFVSGWTSIAGGDILLNKADLLSNNGVSDEILPGGANESILSRNNSESTGLEWITKAAVVSGGLTTTSPASYTLGNAGPVSHTQNEVTTRTLASIIIPANTLVVGDFVWIEALGRKTSGTGADTFTVRIHTNGTALGGTSLCVSSNSSANNSYENAGRFLVTGAATQVGWPAAGNAVYGNFGAAPSSLTLAINADIYINFENQKNTGTDGFDLIMGVVIIHKKR